MEEKNSNKKLIINLVIMALLIGVTFYLLLRDNNLVELWNVIKSANIAYVLCAIGGIALYIISEAINIKRILKFIGEYNVSFFHGIKYAFVGFFFSSITPSSTGGQPAQVYFMKRDNIEISHSSLALLIELTSFQILSITFAIISLLSNYKIVMNLSRVMKLLIIFGIVSNLIVLAFVLIAIFSNAVAVNIVNVILKIGERFKIKEKTKEVIKGELENYKEGSRVILKNPLFMVSVMATTMIQLISTYSVTYFVYKALWLNKFSFLHIIQLQSILSVAVSNIPLPGAVGVSENGFLLLFKSVYSKELLSPAMLLSRGINFYLFLMVSSAVVIYATVRINKRHKLRK